ncbi:MAG: nucleotidyl transferase AbiEii/AbiGii toxin family protein [Phycisphaeraceae bacterium]|nr:nucleotidyl transferase AbiEii/AbiGii toxin family protein [Phycisphaeraceae bacterium]
MKQQPRNTAASVHQQLKNAADKSGERFNDLLQHYALERFLCRLAASPHRGRFILKGALMLRVWEIAAIRPTRDIDLLGRTANDPERIAVIVREVCIATVDPDGLEFDPATVEVGRIAEEAEYDGVRATFAGRLGNARIPMQIDIGFGDRVTPEPVEIEYPSVLGSPGARLIGYTPETTIAEKLHVMLQRGTLNSRMKDFFDIWALSRSRAFDGPVLSSAIRATCEQRGTAVAASPDALTPDALADPQKAVQWTAFRRRLGATDAPETFAEVGGWVAEFLRPAIESVAEGQMLHRTWPPGGPWT